MTPTNTIRIRIFAFLLVVDLDIRLLHFIFNVANAHEHDTYFNYPRNECGIVCGYLRIFYSESGFSMELARVC